jgi:hypothetical protein
MATSININETKQAHAPRFTDEQKEAWQKARALLKSGKTNRRALHIAMSELRLENGRQHKGPIETESKNEGKLTEYKAFLVYSQMAARVAEWKQYLRDPGSRKLYIIARHDLSPSQKAVQASHAAAEFAKRNPLAPWTNGTLVLLCPDPNSIDYQRYTGIHAREGADPFTEFCGRYWFAEFKTEWREPDLIGNPITAIAMLSAYRNEQIGSLPGTKLL